MGMTIEKNGQPIDLSSVYGGLGQFEDALESPSVTYEGIQTHYEHLVRKSEGVFADAGVKTCVLDAEPRASSRGHRAHDRVTWSWWFRGRPLLGKEAASPLVTLVDFANQLSRPARCPSM